MKRISILLFAGLFSGCAGGIPPQSVEELRYGVQNGASMTTVQRYEIDRPFLQAYSAVQTNAKRCLEVTITDSTASREGGKVESVRYRADSMLTSETTGETFLQMDKKGSGKMPHGGYYVLLADIEAIASDKTGIVVYGEVRGYDNIHDSIIAWAEGKNDECPKFPMAGLGKSVIHHSAAGEN